MKRSGFTLIELLVVIAIIAILAAILFPMFARAREKARQTSCSSNIRQLATAVLMYSQDNDEFFPLQWETGVFPGPPCSRHWQIQVGPYIKNLHIFRCPSRVMHPVYQNDPTCEYVMLHAYAAHYGINLTAVGHWDFWDWCYAPCTMLMQSANTGEVQSPAATVMLTEGTGYGDGGVYSCWGFNIYGWGPPVWGSAPWKRPYYLHNETANVAFIDGHVKAMKKGALEAWNGPTPTTECGWPSECSKGRGYWPNTSPDFTLWDKI